MSDPVKCPICRHTMEIVEGEEYGTIICACCDIEIVAKYASRAALIDMWNLYVTKYLDEIEAKDRQAYSRLMHKLDEKLHAAAI